MVAYRAGVGSGRTLQHTHVGVLNFEKIVNAFAKDVFTTLTQSFDDLLLKKSSGVLIWTSSWLPAYGVGAPDQDCPVRHERGA